MAADAGATSTKHAVAVFDPGDKDYNTIAFPSVEIIVFTAFMGELEGEDQRLGVTVLRKPLDIDKLRRALHTALSGS